MRDEEGEQRQERAARITIDLIVQMMTVLFDKAAAYTSLIMLGGYVGIFSIWAFVSGDLHPKVRMWVALLLMISLAIFIAYEIYKMISGAIQTYSLSALVNIRRTPEELLHAFKEHEERRKRKASMPKQIAIWIALWWSLLARRSELSVSLATI